MKVSLAEKPANVKQSATVSTGDTSGTSSVKETKADVNIPTSMGETTNNSQANTALAGQNMKESATKAQEETSQEETNINPGTEKKSPPPAIKTSEADINILTVSQAYDKGTLPKLHSNVMLGIGLIFDKSEQLGINLIDIAGNFDAKYDSGAEDLSFDDFKNDIQMLNQAMNRRKVNQASLEEAFSKMNPQTKATLLAFENAVDKMESDFKAINDDLGQNAEYFARNVFGPVVADENIQAMLEANNAKHDALPFEARIAKQNKMAKDFRQMAQDFVAYSQNQNISEEQILSGLQSKLAKYIEENEISVKDLNVFVKNTGSFGKTMLEGPETIWKKIAKMKDKVCGPKAMLAFSLGAPIISKVLGLLAKIPIIGGAFGAGATMITSFGGYMQNVIESVSKVAVMDETNRQGQKLEEQEANIVGIDSKRPANRSSVYRKTA